MPLTKELESEKDIAFTPVEKQEEDFVPLYKRNYNKSPKKGKKKGKSPVIKSEREKNPKWHN